MVVRAVKRKSYFVLNLFVSDPKGKGWDLTA
jgi:hypothetical protein